MSTGETHDREKNMGRFWLHLEHAAIGPLDVGEVIYRNKPCREDEARCLRSGGDLADLCAVRDAPDLAAQEAALTSARAKWRRISLEQKGLAVASTPASEPCEFKGDSREAQYKKAVECLVEAEVAPERIGHLLSELKAAASERQRDAAFSVITATCIGRASNPARIIDLVNEK